MVRLRGWEGFAAGRASWPRRSRKEGKSAGLFYFLLSPEKVNAQRVGGGVLVGLRGREGVGVGKERGAILFFTFSGESEYAADWRGV
ncbi:MAG: hypothetical protein GX589_02230 [Deltaproteobacteria bacterium]|nr:hypothetical protein [Deltaproteobacteria bacterium]